ncbi:MAG: hypothetical protein WBQ72_01140 [Terriglobales bacterium]
MKQLLRIALVLSLVCAAIGAFSPAAHAQKIDFAFGVSAMDAPGASNGDSNHNPVSLTGGAYPGFSGDVLFWHNVGVGGEIFWRASQANNYAGQGFNFRPVFYNFNGVYSPRLAPRTYLELVGGIGAEDTHYYTGTVCGIYSCSNYQSINHFDGDLGGGLKLYATKGFFIRPEARVYLVHNNQEFSSWHNTRYGVSIGYTCH